MPTYNLQKDGSFLITDYNQASPFSNFLPGIAGCWGIPLWAFYVNRGQALSSFGLKDKDGSIAEFFPANKAYSLTPFFAFRTFIKASRTFYEPFAIKKLDPAISQSMQISSSSLKLTDKNPKLGLQTRVSYFTLPNQPPACLVRKVTFKNTSNKLLKLQALDGLARIIPYGAANSLLKEMSRTLEAWMHTSFEKNLALFRLIVDPADVAQTTLIKGAAFNFSFYRQNTKLIYPKLLVDPDSVFGTNLSYSLPEAFLKSNFSSDYPQVLCGKTPSAFSFLDLKLRPNQELTLYNLFGAAFEVNLINQLLEIASPDFLLEKELENKRIIDSIKSRAFSLSGLPEFDAYLSSTYLDNISRGGLPYQPDSGPKHARPYYIYSRKHGDPERDYNYFNLSPSFFSEGQGNYRDVNQNRRMDLFFLPQLKTENITYFLNLIQIDGYNPLLVKGQKLFLDLKTAKQISKQYQLKKKKFLHLLVKGFYLGEFFEMLAQEQLSLDKEALTSLILDKAQRRAQASHGEGYWIDHWYYCLDLIENYLNIYPDSLRELFFDTEFTFFDDKYRIKPRRSRYHLRKGIVYQGESIEVDKQKAALIKARKQYKNILHNQENTPYKTTLVEKLLVITLNKAATFDPDGLGIEMEADKPGWCDSVNGLPALFGSSLCQSLQLRRAAKLLRTALLELNQPVTIAKNTFNFFTALNTELSKYHQGKSKSRDFTYWDKANKAKESFRRNAFYRVSGQKTLKPEKITAFLDSLIRKIDKSLPRVKDKKSGLYPTYFTYQVTKFKKTNHHPRPLAFKRHNLPLFLEGLVHALACLDSSSRQKQALYQNTKKSLLYDQKLKMYKLNASLAAEPLEIGRSRIFTPGWLENESIWLHMEYKYLLQLLKAGLYRQFYTEFKNCLICFQDPKVYGRSILENSSFLASSRHPDPSFHGKGFVARLTGATAELLNIWLVLALGKKPFSLDKNKTLIFSPQPLLAKEFFSKTSSQIKWFEQRLKIPKNTYSFRLFTKTLLIYHNPARLDTFAKNCRIKQINLEIAGKTLTSKSRVRGKIAQAIRNQEVTKIDIYLG